MALLLSTLEEAEIASAAGSVAARYRTGLPNYAQGPFARCEFLDIDPDTMSVLSDREAREICFFLKSLRWSAWNSKRPAMVVACRSRHSKLAKESRRLRGVGLTFVPATNQKAGDNRGDRQRTLSILNRNRGTACRAFTGESSGSDEELFRLAPKRDVSDTLGQHGPE